MRSGGDGFDEQGHHCRQAATVVDMIRICKRSHDIFVDEIGFPPEDTIRDPNMLTIGPVAQARRSTLLLD